MSVYTQAGAASPSFEQAAAVSGRHAWVLGASGSTSFVMAWDGKAWSRMKALPAGLEANMIAASSPSDVWVFGRFADQAVSRALRWNGQRWISLAWRGAPDG